MAADSISTRPLTLYALQWVEQVVSEQFASPRVVSRGILHKVRDLPGLIAVRNGQQVGLLQYRIEDRELEVVILISLAPRTGVGRTLLAAAEPIARSAGCRRMWLVTTDNNAAGLAFYRALAWRQAAIHAGALDIARRIKPEIPEFDDQGRPLRDEVEFELMLGDPAAGRGL